MKTFIAVLAIFFLMMVSIPAQSQVLPCTNGMPPIRDGRLQHAVEQLKLEHPAIRFQDDDAPCLQAKNTAQALRRTLGRNYLERIAGYEFVVIANDKGYFTVERFKSQRPRNLQALATALKNHHSRRLKVEANTSYEYFLAGNSIVIMISSAAEREDHSKMFGEMQQTFSSWAAISSESP